MKDKSYQAFPLGQVAAEYLRLKSKRLTRASQEMYELTLATLANAYPTVELAELEPPNGTRLLEDLLARKWGHLNPKTYNKNLTVLRDFCKWCVLRELLHGNPTTPIERAKTRPFHRSTFTNEQCDAIISSTRDTRYRLAVRLLLHYGIRKGALGAVRLEHFDQHREQLTIFTKGEKIHWIPIPDESFWRDLRELLNEPGAHPSDYLLCKQRVYTGRRRGAPLLRALVGKHLAAARDVILELEKLDAEGGLPLISDLIDQLHVLATRPGLIGETILRRDRTQPLGMDNLHLWWYRRLECAGVVAPGVTRGARMHAARHTAGQRVLDVTGNLVAAQRLLCHANIATTGDNYLGWDSGQLREDLTAALADRVKGAPSRV